MNLANDTLSECSNELSLGLQHIGNISVGLLELPAELAVR